MNTKTKNILWAVFAVAMVVIGVIWFLSDDLEHIEDTNGADNYALTTITDENIINMDIGALNVKRSNAIIGDTVTYSSDKFTGVYELYSENLIGTNIDITVNHTRVDAGNFRLVLLVDDEIVHEFKLNELTQTYRLESVAGTMSLRIAGESAAFQLDYDVY